MGMFDYVKLEGEDVLQMASDAGLDLEDTNLQTKEYLNIMTTFILTDEGLYESWPIKKETGKILSRDIGGHTIEFPEFEIIGEKRRFLRFHGDFNFTGKSRDGETSNYFAVYRLQNNGLFNLVEINKGYSFEEFYSSDGWQETYF